MSGNQLSSQFLQTPVRLQAKVTNILEKSSYQEVYLSDVKLSDGRNNKTLTQMVWQDDSSNDVTIGDWVLLQGEISEFDSATNPGQFDSKAYYEAKGIRYRIWGGRLEKRRKSRIPIYGFLKALKGKISNVYDSTLEEEDSQILHAMVLGDKSDLGTDLKTLYQKAGISHILAISGLHVSMIGLVLFKLLKKVGMHHNLASVLCILLITLYGIMTGFSVSTNRAVVMMGLSLSACLVSRSYDSLSAIAMSGFIILVQEPYQLFQCSFLLSFLAVFGTLFFYPFVKEYLKGCFPDFERNMGIKEKSEYHSLSVFLNKVTRLFRETFLVSCSIQFITLPVLLCSFYEFASMAPIVNLFILPLTSLLMILAILIAIAGSIWLPAGCFLGGSVHYILQFYQLVCQTFEKLPFNRILTGCPKLGQVLLFLVCVILFCVIVKWKNRCLAGLLLVTGLVILLYHIPVPSLQITMLDIGQGDSIFWETEDGKTFLMDGGSTDNKAVGTYRILPFLKYKGVSALDYCFLSHMDEDHINGVKELLTNASTQKDIRIRYLVLARIKDKDEPYLEMEQLAEKAGAKVLYVERGSRLTTGNLALKCLHPAKDYHTDDRNGYSIVLDLSYGKSKYFHMLLTGDVDETGEQSMLKYNEFSSHHYDILKVAHHGSRFSTSKEWLERIQPKLALISYGENNRYGHPHKELLERLRSAGIAKFSTCECGAITVRVKEKRMEIHEYRNHKSVFTCNLSEY